MESPSNFHTLKGYQLQEEVKITPSMEDYLEMICRMYKEQKPVRINELAQLLNVKPSSASKMVQNLKESHLVDFQKYGYISPTSEGQRLGEYMLYRHEVLLSFLRLLNGSDNQLEQVEKIEHFIDKKTIENLEQLTKRLSQKHTTIPAPNSGIPGC